MTIPNLSLRQPLFPVNLDGSFVPHGYPCFTFSATKFAKNNFVYIKLMPAKNHITQLVLVNSISIYTSALTAKP